MPKSEEGAIKLEHAGALARLETAIRFGENARVEMNAAGAAMAENAPLRKLVYSWDAALAHLLQEAGFRRDDLRR